MLQGLIQVPGSSMVKPDRKSTRLNSSHGYISYAVFCLTKKNALLPGASRARDSDPLCPSILGRAGHRWCCGGLGRRGIRPLFFFNDTAPTEIYTLSLHDALPIT